MKTTRQAVKLDAVRCYQNHKDLSVRGCAAKLGIGYNTLTKWQKEASSNLINIIFYILASL